MIDDILTPMYDGKPEDFNWVGFGSGSGTNLRECAKIIKPKLIFSDRPKAELLQLEELADVEKIILNGYEFCGSWKKAQGNPRMVADYIKKSFDYNQLITDRLREFETKEGIEIHLIVLGGYMRLIKKPLLEAFPDKIMNVHPADLSILICENGRWRRKYIGENAVYDILKAGEKNTRSSVIIVDEGEDHGEILTQGPELEVWNKFLEGRKRNEIIETEYGAFQDEQKEKSDWPALTTALKMISEGRIALGARKAFYNEWRTTYVDDRAMAYEGYRI
jgi:folate-dependent phosphoribosylglycinamide formyltransferase PurN